MTEKFFPFDPAEYLDSSEAIESFLNDAFNTRDPGYIAKAFGVVTRSKGMTAVAAETGLSREQLYKSLSSQGNPTLTTILAVMKSLGFGLQVKSE